MVKPAYIILERSLMFIGFLWVNPWKHFNNKKMASKNILGPKKNLGPKQIFWPNKILVPKFGFKKIWFQKRFGPTLFLALKNFCPQKLLGPKNVGSEKVFGCKKKLVLKIFWVQNISSV